MVIKGTSCAGARRIAAHLSCTQTNERNVLHELRGVAAEDLLGALREMEVVAAATRCKKPFYHASINTPAHEQLTDVERALAVERLEAALGLSGQPRVVVIHRKNDRVHCHIVWSRIDLMRMRAISDSHNYRKHELVARALEREFGHARVQGAHVEREGRPRPKRTPSHAEMLQAERTGISPQDVTKQITDIWRCTSSGWEFAGKLEQAGFLLARGDRRDFVVVDAKGGVHSLARRVEGATAKDIRQRMADLDPARLPSVVEARRTLRQRSTKNTGPTEAPPFRRQKGLPAGSPATAQNRMTARSAPPHGESKFARKMNYHPHSVVDRKGTRTAHRLAKVTGEQGNRFLHRGRVRALPRMFYVRLKPARSNGVWFGSNPHAENHTAIRGKWKLFEREERIEVSGLAARGHGRANHRFCR